ncbi:antA/AntB antirepressor family protein [Clostridium botulinum]|nr:antA/AntB antirepressor family protein [Clostridium botulinum]MCS4474818.1 antA/AntB antirepressor family protein [Clostridium botulinum]
MKKLNLSIENGAPIATEIENVLPINQNGDGEIIVSGRNLHDFLEVESKYQDWIKRMIEYGFNFGVDYAITTELSQKKRVQDWLREN